MVNDAIATIRKQYGMTGPGATQDVERFEKASLKAQMRFIKLWLVALRRLRAFDYNQLQVEFAPLNGSLDAIQRPLIKDMEAWLECWTALATAVHGQEARTAIKELFPPRQKTLEEIIQDKNAEDQNRSEDRWRFLHH